MRRFYREMIDDSKRKDYLYFTVVDERLHSHDSSTLSDMKKWAKWRSSLETAWLYHDHREAAYRTYDSKLYTSYKIATGQ